MPVAFVVSLIGLFKDADKGYAVAGLVLSGLLPLLVVLATACR